MKISIIVPMYNVEVYIDKCIQSCLNQDIEKTEYEIICVNDGSPDESAIIARNYACIYDNIKVIDRNNGGLSAARNTGLHNAKGEYVWFVDSDDWIENNCLGAVTPYLKNDLDLLEIQYQNVSENGNVYPGEAGHFFKGVKSGREVSRRGGVHTPAPFSIYRLQYLKDHNLYFYEGIYHEDVEFKVRALLLADRVASIPNVCYNYLQRSHGSITSVFKLKNGLDMLFVLDRHYRFVQSYDRGVKKAIYGKISMWMNSILLGFRQLNEDDYQILYKELIQNKHLFCAMKHSGNFKYFIEGVLLGINVRFGMKIHSMIR